MQNIWEAVKNYYIALGKNYHVDPLIFLGIHIIATPLFIFSLAWLIKNYPQKEIYSLAGNYCGIYFNAANNYLVTFGTNIPWWIYTLLVVTTIISSFFSYKKVRKKITAV